MKEFNIKVKIRFKDNDETTNEEKQLIAAAKEATFRSYAPYSNFHVGAAVLLDDGTIITGNNQENCAYPSGICAERTALFYANSQYPEKKVSGLCIAARDTSGNFTSTPISPCGSCRQVLFETEQRYNSNITIILYGTKGAYIIESARCLLPISFDKSFL